MSKKIFLMTIFLCFGLFGLSENSWAAPYPYYYVDHTMVGADHTIYKRTCLNENAEGIIWNLCTPPEIKTTSELGLGSNVINSTGSFVYSYAGSQKLIRTATSSDGGTSWLQKCDINNSSGIVEGSCTAWSGGSNSALQVGNGYFSSSTGYVYTVNGVQKLLQSLVSKDGATAWSRECDLTFDGLGDINWSNCTNGWSPVAVNSIGLGDVLISYNGGIVSWKNDQQELLQIVIRQDGVYSWTRICPIDSGSGILWNSCGSWNQALNASQGLGNIISSDGFTFGLNNKLYFWTATKADAQLVKAMNAYLVVNPIENLAAQTGQTIAQIHALGGLTKDQKARTVLTAICGTEPTSSLDAIAEWRLCTLPVAFMLMDYFSWKGDRDWVNTYGYAAISEVDSLVAKSSLPPLHGLAGANHRLGETYYTRRYINDTGTGVFTGFGWFKTQGLMDQYYCTSLETPYDSGGSCKTINLSNRIYYVLRNSIVSTADYASLYPGDVNFLGRSAAGRAAAAKVSGDASLISSLVPTAQNLTYAELGTDANVGNPVPWNLFGFSDIFQHLQTMLNTDDWQMPASHQYLSQVWSNVYFGSYFSTANPIADIDDNTYIAGNVATSFSQSIYDCSQAGGNFYNASGIITGIRGEPLNDALITIGPGLYWALTSASNSSVADDVLLKTSRATNAFLLSLPLWSNETCDPTPILAFVPKNQLAIAMRTFAYLYFAHQGWNRTALGNYYTAVTSAPQGLSVQ